MGITKWCTYVSPVRYGELVIVYIPSQWAMPNMLAVVNSRAVYLNH